MTYLEAVNRVLIRLREEEVTTVNQNSYSKLIGTFVNDAKRMVEDAWDWSALRTTLTISTTTDIFNYVLTGSGNRIKIIDVINDTSNWFMTYKDTHWMDNAFLIETPPIGSPQFYSFNGVDANGDTQVDLYPIPNGAYNLRFNIIKPQPALTTDASNLLIPYEPVIFGALARAIAERGEDGGLNSNEIYQLYKQSLGDAIALESGRYLEEDSWTAN